MKKDTPEITITEEERSRLRELYEEKVLPLNDEFDRQLSEAVIALLKSSAVGACIIAGLYFVMAHFNCFTPERFRVFDMELPCSPLKFFFYAVVGVCMQIGGAFIRRLNRRSLLFRENAVPELARMIDPELKYVAEGNVMPSQYYESQLYSKFDEYDGSDLFCGTYRGIPLRFSMVHATRSNGKSKYNIFHGVFFVVDFNKEFHSLTIVKPDVMERQLGRGISSFFQKIDVSQPGKLIRMEDAEFEKAFVITTMDEVEARYQLTPNLMERILKMKKRFEPLPVALSFANSKLYIGISIFYNTKISSGLPADNNFFGYRGGKVSLDELEKIYKKIKSFVSIVDDLNLTLRIWSKE